MLRKIIAVYVLSCKPRQEAYLNSISVFASCQNDDREILEKCVKGQHQKRMTQKTLSATVTELKNNNILTRLQKGEFIDFEHLYDTVRGLIRPIKGIGDLTTYDTALRLGHIYGLRPQQYVYLACGAKKGAEKLYARKDFRFREPYSFFEPLLGTLDAQEIEDFLCIMKKYLVKAGVRSSFDAILNSKKSCLDDMYKSCCSHLYTDESMQEFVDDICDNIN